MRDRNRGTIIYTSSRAAVAVRHHRGIQDSRTAVNGCSARTFPGRRPTAVARPLLHDLLLFSRMNSTRRRKSITVSTTTAWPSLPLDGRVTDKSAGISLFSIHPGEVETSLHTTGFPEKTHKEAPYIIEHMKALDAKRPRFEASLAAWTCVYLASGKASTLRGRYVDCTRDVEEAQALYASQT